MRWFHWLRFAGWMAWLQGCVWACGLPHPSWERLRAGCLLLGFGLVLIGLELVVILRADQRERQ